MELYTIDPTDSNRREFLIESFESFIWTDRYSAHGDIELVTEPSALMVSRLVPDTLIGFDESSRVMMIESSFREVNDDGKKLLTIKGKSLEFLLEGRVAKRVSNPATWDLTGSPGQIVADMVYIICVLGTGISVNDIIPNLTSANLSGSLPSQTIQVKPGSLYERGKEICDSFDLGFRIRVTPGVADRAFEVYKGTDRSGKNGVAFSEELDNLSQTSYLVSKDGYKNVAYVYSDIGSRIVTATGMTNVSGLARKVLMVEATDITGDWNDAAQPVQKALDQRGLDALSEHKVMTLFDGIANPNTTYKYNSDYFLGDLVVLIGDDKSRKIVRVTEHIWSGDNEGIKSYPTFSEIGGV